MQYPKITIITPSFNQGRYIEQTITSILNQGYPNLEYMIIDGGSTDETVEIIKKYEDRITYWVSERDRGQAHAINKGLERTTGDIVNWINSDDYLEQGALDALAEGYLANPKAEVFCGYTHCFWDATGATSHTYRMGLKKSVACTILNIEMNQPGTFYKTQIIKGLGGINESLRYVFDNELWMRYLCAHGQSHVVMMKALLAHFRQHGQSKSFGEGFEKFYFEQLSIFNYLTFSLDLPKFLLHYIQRDTPDNEYKSIATWNTDYLDKQIVLAYYANKYMITLYNTGMVNDAFNCLKVALKFRMFKMNRKNLSLLLKSLVKHRI